VEGRILLKVKLATREDRGISEEESWTESQQHEELMMFFIDHEIRRFKVGTHDKISA
jgi:BAI1-associated protein 3